MQPCRILRRALHKSISVGFWHALCYIRSFRYPPFAVAYTDSAQVHVQGETVTFAASRLVLRISPGIAQILVSVRLSPTAKLCVVVIVRPGIPRASLAIGRPWLALHHPGRRK
jgi:hypothetical protein